MPKTKLMGPEREHVLVGLELAQIVGARVGGAPLVARAQAVLRGH